MHEICFAVVILLVAIRQNLRWEERKLKNAICPVARLKKRRKAGPKGGGLGSSKDPMGAGIH